MTPLVYRFFAEQHRTDHTVCILKTRTRLEYIAEYSQRDRSCSKKSRYEWLTPASYHAVTFAITIRMLLGNVAFHRPNLLYILTWDSWS